MIVIYILLALFLLSILSWGLKPAIFVREKNLPSETLKGKHTDWIWGFRWIPRRLTALVNSKKDLGHILGYRQYPVQLLGSNRKVVLGISIQDVPDKGTYSLSWPLHFAKVFSGGRGFALGIRKTYWGDTDDIRDGTDYWTFRFAVKRFYEKSNN